MAQPSTTAHSFLQSSILPPSGSAQPGSFSVGSLSEDLIRFGFLPFTSLYRDASAQSRGLVVVVVVVVVMVAVDVVV